MARNAFNRGILDWLPDQQQRGPAGVPAPQNSFMPADYQRAAQAGATRNDPTWAGTVAQDAWANLRAAPQQDPWVYTPTPADWGMDYAKSPQEQAAAIASGLPPDPNAAANPAVPGNTAKPSVTSNPNTPPAVAPAQNAARWFEPDVEGSFGSQWDGTRWVDNPNGTPAGQAIGKTGATLPVGYNAKADTYRHEYNGQAAESSRTRVMRWASDNQRLYGMDAQAAVNSALARLKRDMGANWAQSGFDLSLIQAAPPGQDNFVPPPPATPAPGTTPPGTTGGGGATSDPSAPPNGGGGQNAVNTAIAGDRNMQLALFLQQIGIDPANNKGIFGRKIADTIQSVLPAYMDLQGFGMKPGEGANPGDNVEQNLRGLAAIFNGTGGFNAALQQAGNQAAAQLGEGSWAAKNLDEASIYQALGNITNLRTRGENGLMQQAYRDYYDNAITASRMNQLERIRNGQGYSSAADWLRQSPWADLLS